MYDHTIHLFKQHKILTLAQLITLKKATFIWKLANGCLPSVLSKLFVTNAQNHLKFVIPHPRNEKDKLQIVTSSIIAWNTVPDDIKNTTIYSNFVRRFKEYLIDPTSIKKITK